MKTIVKYKNEEFINVREAVRKEIISPRTARNLLKPSDTNDKASVIKLFGEEFIAKADLSTTIVNKLKNYEKENAKPEAETDPKDINEIEFLLLFVMANDRFWRQHLTRFDNSYLLDREKEKLAKTFLLIDCLLGLNGEGYKLQNLFQAYKNVKEKFELSNFDCNTYDYFTKKLKDTRINGIEKSIINLKRGVERVKRILSPVHQKYIIKFYAHPSKFNYKKIRDLVNHEVIKLGLKPISLSTIKAFLAQPEIQNTYKPFRIGKKWAEDFLYPYLIREKPKKTNYQWQSDCTSLNFYVADENGEPTRMWICAVIDAKSRKIISWLIGRYETTELVLNTLFNAILTTRMIPFEYLHDNSSAFTSKRMKEVEARMESLGSYVRLSRPGNAKDRGLGEVTWSILQSEWRNERGYLGDGVRSYLEEGRVDPEVRTAYFQGKKDGIWHVNQLKEMLSRTIKNYNDKAL